MQPALPKSSSSLYLFLLFTLWALVLTYPLPQYFFTHIPRGSEEAATVPFFNLWTLQWNIDQLVHGYPGYWDAPIFAPDRGTFAFSEPQPLSALLAMPVWLASQAPAAGYNFVIILFLTLNGWFAFWLLRSWGVSSGASLWAGLLLQSLPFVAQEMGVLQLVAVFGFLWTLLYLSRLLSSSPRWQTGFCLALGPPLTFFTCGYYGVFSLFFLPLALLFQIRREHFGLKRAGQLLLIGLLAAALTAPFLWAQQQYLAQYGFRRSVQTVESNSAKLSYYRNFLDYHLLYGKILELKSPQGQRLFPGLGLVALAGLGLFGGQSKRLKLYLVLAVVLAVLLSLGLRLNLGEVQPYQWLREIVPGLAQLRSPFRFAVFGQLHLALLAGFGLENVSRWLPWRPTALRVGLAALAIFEMLALPLPLQELPPLQAPEPWQTWLNQQVVNASATEPMPNGWPPKIVLLPFAHSSNVEDFEQTTRWMLANRFLKGAMLNGYSGFFPADHGRVRKEMGQFPSPASVQLFQQKGITYVVVDHRLAQAPGPAEITLHFPLVFQDNTHDIAVYKVQ